MGTCRELSFYEGKEIADLSGFNRCERMGLQELFQAASRKTKWENHNHNHLSPLKKEERRIENIPILLQNLGSR